MSWRYFEKFGRVYEKYLSKRGEGTTLAEQTATAVNRLVNMWFQNGDTYDNVRTVLYGGLNDLSPCANWLYMYRPETRDILDRIPRCYTLLDYEGVLTSLADLLLNEQAMESVSHTPAQGSIYKCTGPFGCRWPE